MIAHRVVALPIPSPIVWNIGAEGQFLDRRRRPAAGSPRQNQTAHRQREPWVLPAMLLSRRCGRRAYNAADFPAISAGYGSEPSEILTSLMLVYVGRSLS